MTTIGNARTIRSFEHDGIALAYDDLGDRAAPPVVLVHGGTVSRETWTQLASRLEGAHRVMAIDMAGHGDSDRAPGEYSIPEQGDRIAAFCEEVAGREVVLVGHSFGGAVAAYVAATRPHLVRGLVLEDPPMFMFDPDVWPTTTFSMLFSALHQAMLQAAASDDPFAAMRSWILALPPLGDRGTYADILGPDGVERRARAWSKCDPNLLDGNEDHAAVGQIWGDHDPDSPIACPVLVVRADPATMPGFRPEDEERFRRLAPHASFVVADGSGHDIHEEQPVWFADHVEAFLASV